MTTDASLPLPPQSVEQAPPWAAAPWTPPEPLVQRLPDSIAARALLGAVAAGVLAQLLFAFQMLGLNFPIWIAVVLAAAWRYRPREVPFDRLDIWLPVSALIFASFVALREDGMLLMFDFVAACSLTLASVVAFGGHAVTRGPWARVVALGAKSIAVYFVGAVYLLPGAKPIVMAFTERRGERWRPLLRGLLLAIPLLFVFGVLFAAADAIFANQLRNVVNFDWLGPELIFRLVLASIAAWLFAGTLACAWLAHRAVNPSASGAASARLGTTEALVVLLALDAMFAVFAALQAAYLLGGLDTFAVSGMTYSDYARRGFFELIIAAFLAGAVIVVVDRVIAGRPLLYRLAAAALAVLTGFVVLAAVVRLGLYQQAYGWTELRFYALAAICWLAAGVVITLAAVLTNRARWVLQFVVGAGLVVAVACNAIGPQAFVTEQNLQRAIRPELVAEGGKDGLDILYLRVLGADSVPALVAAKDRLQPQAAADLDLVLRDSAESLRMDATRLGWQSWNLARQRALDALVAAGY
jgi:hypothetical protein